MLVEGEIKDSVKEKVEVVPEVKEEEPMDKKAKVPQQETIFCTNCGAQNPLSSNFCYKCGTKLTKVG